MPRGGPPEDAFRGCSEGRGGLGERTKRADKTPRLGHFRWRGGDGGLIREVRREKARGASADNSEIFLLCKGENMNAVLVAMVVAQGRGWMYAHTYVRTRVCARVYISGDVLQFQC